VSEFINILQVHVLSQAIYESRSLEDLGETGKAIKAMNLGDKTKNIIRQLYISRQEELEAHGGSDKHFD
jgi:hypothetical protein|tara:strand:+ start:198 stop:404 length:207 start_codon:yes stop_codon:yes gene_type:complete